MIIIISRRTWPQIQIQIQIQNQIHIQIVSRFRLLSALPEFRSNQTESYDKYPCTCGTAENALS